MNREIVFDAVKQVIRCNICKEEKALETPQPVKEFMTWTKEFEDKHKGCK